MTPNIPYLGPSRAHKLDLYEPRRSDIGPRPAIVIIHGGGWTVGDKQSTREAQMADLLSAAGFVCISINYQMIENDKPAWPTYLDDAREAVRFLRRNAEKYRVDPDRIGAIGGSAGGNIALMLGLKVPGEVPANVQAIVALYAPTDMSWNDTESTLLFGCTEEALPTIAAKASPLVQATADFPPTFLIHGTNDTIVSLEHSENMAARLTELGVTHKLKIIEGAPHSFKLRDHNASVRDAVVSFFDKHLTAR